MDQYQPFMFERLDKDYVIYELTLKGVKDISNKSKRETLAKNVSYMLGCEQAGIEYEIDIILDPVNEIPICIEILAHLSS